MGQRVWCDLHPDRPALSLTRLTPLRENMAGGGTGHRVSAMRQPEPTQITLASLHHIWSDAAYDL